MRVYFAHSKEFDFINEYYKPIKDSENLKNLALLFPHKISDESRNGRDFYKSIDLIIAEVSYPAIGLGIELAWAYGDKIPIYCFYKPGHKPSASLNSVTDEIAEYSSTEDLVSKINDVIDQYK